MSSRHAIGQEGSDEETRDEQLEDEFEVVAEDVEFRASVEQEIQARVDTEAAGMQSAGLTLVEEERLIGREWEIERTRERYDRRQESTREARTRKTAAQQRVECRIEFERWAGSVNHWLDPDVVDPREQLSQAELGSVNKEAARITERLEGWSRATVSRRLAEHVVDGLDVTEAVLRVLEERRRAAGHVIPIAAVEDVDREEVSIQGRVVELWEPSHPAIAQVGLLEDESGRIKFTSWIESDQPSVEEDTEVVFRGVARNWYEGRVSVALTGTSSVTVSNGAGERWWDT